MVAAEALQIKQAPFILGLEPSVKESAFLDTPTLYQRVGLNSGNLAFHFAIDCHLGGDVNVADWSAPIAQIDASGSIAVVPCANQLGPHLNYGGLAKKFQSATVPMVAIGLGAQGGTDGKVPDVPQGTLDWVRAIAEHAPSSNPNISVRGPFSLEVLDHYGLADAAVVLGCPSLHINADPNLGQKIASNLREPKRIAVVAGHQGWKHLAKLEASLNAMLTATGGSYIGQSPGEMISLTRGEAERMDREQLSICRDFACPHLTLDEFVQWSREYGNVFFDVPAWMEHYHHFDFVIGARIHGVILALQAGVPALCVAHDSRTLELCEVMQIPHVLANDVINGIARKDLLKLFNFDPDEFDANRKKLASRYTEFLDGNGIRPSADLLRLSQ